MNRPHCVSPSVKSSVPPLPTWPCGLKAAEEQLREVGALGHSINDLNNMLKLPHLRGQFGEASLERLLADFLPAHMFEIQSTLPDGGRADAVIQFPDRRLPIDAKFPREQVLALFESGDEAEIEEARHEFVRVMKAEAKRRKHSTKHQPI